MNKKTPSLYAFWGTASVGGNGNARLCLGFGAAADEAAEQLANERVQRADDEIHQQRQN